MSKKYKNYSNYTKKEEPKPNDEVKEIPEQKPVSDNKKFGIVVNCFALNIREQSSLYSNIIGELKKDDKVEIIEEKDKFYKIKTKSNVVGYCVSNYIKTECE